MGIISSVALISASCDKPQRIQYCPDMEAKVEMSQRTEYEQEPEIYDLIEEEIYVETDEFSDEIQEETTLPEESSYVLYEGFDSSFKTYMDYRCITDASSVQYELQQQAYTDERGFRRIGDDYCVAMGTGITSGCGERFIVTLESGNSFSVIIADIKADEHTDVTNCFVPGGDNSGNVIEFIIDTDSAYSDMLSSGNAGYFDDLSGNIISIEMQ